MVVSFPQEIDQMKSRLARDEVNVEVDSARGPELATVLSELRTQYEGIVKRNKEQAEEWYRKKVSTQTGSFSCQKKTSQQEQESNQSSLQMVKLLIG